MWISNANEGCIKIFSTFRSLLLSVYESDLDGNLSPAFSFALLNLMRRIYWWEGLLNEILFIAFITNSRVSNIFSAFRTARLNRSNPPTADPTLVLIDSRLFWPKLSRVIFQLNMQICNLNSYSAKTEIICWDGFCLLLGEVIPICLKCSLRPRDKNNL